jgi:hypothetical protein
MRLYAVVACVAVAALTSAASSKQILDTNAVVAVAVQITCPGDSVQASISPYIAQVPQGAQIEWTLVNSPDVPEIQIDKKAGKGWPYGNSLPYHGSAKNPAKGQSMHPNQAGKKFSYNITGTCTPEGQDPRRVVIDPDMIIIH